MPSFATESQWWPLHRASTRADGRQLLIITVAGLAAEPQDSAVSASGRAVWLFDSLPRGELWLAHAVGRPDGVSGALPGPGLGKKNRVAPSTQEKRKGRSLATHLSESDTADTHRS